MLIEANGNTMAISITKEGYHLAHIMHIGFVLLCIFDLHGCLVHIAQEFCSIICIDIAIVHPILVRPRGVVGYECEIVVQRRDGIDTHFPPGQRECGI